MPSCFVTEKKTQVLPVTFVTPTSYTAWLESQSSVIKEWLKGTQFKPEVSAVRLLPDAHGKMARVICCVESMENFWGVGHLPLTLPEGLYEFADLTESQYSAFAIAWGLGAYQYTRYKKPQREAAQLYVPKEILNAVNNMVDSIYFVRDLVNTPTDDMGPTQLAEAAKNLAQQYDAKFSQIVGDDLLTQNYACIHTVGRASDDPPRLLDLRWGNPSHPKVTLVGKGVCFDTGGLDIKSSPYMLLMKKDMAGGAHALGLARMIMHAKLPICLRVLIPAVENAISGNAYRPGDVIKSRKGLTVEIANTDAEGRLVLADALTEAVSEKPELVIDLSTLTGAARVALGTELPAVFSNNDALVDEVMKVGKKLHDPIWRLPLFAMYRESLNTPIADISNCSSDGYGGAITAALFLKEFVPDEIPWMHFDFMAWNLRPRPGKPQGGEAVTLRALFTYLQGRYQ